METPTLNALSQTPTGGRDPVTNAKPAKKQLDQTDFLNLLMRQLQYQDPLKPMDNQEFTSQLTSFSSLNQLVDLNAKLDTLQSVQLAMTQLQATSLIGKEVSVRGNLVHLGAGGTADIPFQLAADAGRVTVHVVDKDGNVVRTIEAGELKAGERTVAWDGKDDKGKAAPEGNYTIEVNAFDAQGKKVAVETLMRGVVSGVDLSGVEVMMTINGVQVPLSALLAVRTPPSVT
jgi:flagellar basal-body rod modification protein FlgD